MAHNTERVAAKHTYESGRAHVCARKRDRSVAREPLQERSLQRRYRPKASFLKRSRSPRSERFGSCTCPIRCNTCATGGSETLTHQGFPAIASLSSQSVVLFRTAFSPVTAISKRRPRDPTQHVRTTCPRNPYVPRVAGDRVAFFTKRPSGRSRRSASNAPTSSGTDRRAPSAVERSYRDVDVQLGVTRVLVRVVK